MWKVVGHACGWSPDVLAKANQDGKLFGDHIGEHSMCILGARYTESVIRHLRSASAPRLLCVRVLISITIPKS